jgi:thymidylate synthase (FAD)
MKVRIIAKTTGAIGTEYEGKSIDDIIVGIARVSSSRDTNDLFDEPYKLLRHCALNQHWSVFESASLTFEVYTSRAISHEIIRHKSMSFQEFSLRYAEAIDIEPIELREQSKNNRQSSTEIINPVNKHNYPYAYVVDSNINNTETLYKQLIDNNVARETARFILPLATTTKINMTANVRSIITFLNARLHKTAQKEIRLVAEAIRDIFIKECPIISECFFNFDNAYNIHILERLVLEKYKLYELIDSETGKVKRFIG